MASEKLCQQALDQFEEELSIKKDVIALGIVSTDEKNPASDDLAIAVYVTKQSRPEDISEKDIIPDMLELESEGKPEKVPVRVIVQGEVSLEGFGLE